MASMTIGAGAIAKVQTYPNPCVVAIYSPSISGSGQIGFQGSENVTTPNGCSIAADSPSTSAIQFTGGPPAPPSLLAVGGCTNNSSGQQCSGVTTNILPILVPSGLTSL